ncbi:hypothetical protein [Streptomyces iconiensis]|uniref:Uncharacterized protein n=1 Tax=Streptomyces iconiensis TaxID=1384038 RepID=A0ABT7A8F1_9ACTN|nr:hypothetical protein [Streptomyces iconiensis]MDJ1137626.1 hypothetical protein [Streptomyces iconiensis]
MSRAAEIDFTFFSTIQTHVALDALAANGVSFEFEGRVTYVIDVDGMFDWAHAAPGDLQRVKESAAHAAPTTTFGITAILGERTGGDFLFHPQRDTVSFMPEVNRRLLPDSTFCDFGWYLHRLVPVFEPFGLTKVETAEY